MSQICNEVDEIKEQYEVLVGLVSEYYTKNKSNQFKYLNETLEYLRKKNIKTEKISSPATENKNITISDFKKEKAIFKNAPNATINFNAILVYCDSFNYSSKEKNIIPYNANISTFEYNKKQGQFNYKKDMFTKPVFYNKDLNVFFITTAVYKQIPNTIKVLCKTISEDNFSHFKDNQDYNTLRYKTYSQAILEQMDYNSQQLILQTQKRQEILKSVIDSKILKIPDLINYLNWAIKNNKTNPTKKHFIESWQNDLSYVIDLNQDTSLQ